MRDWTKRIGINEYRFRAGTVRACIIDRGEMRRTIANVRWDDDDTYETGRGFPAALDLETGDRVMLVEQVAPLFGQDGGWVLVTSVRATSFTPRGNVSPPPGISIDAIKEEIQTLFLLALVAGTAAMAAHHFVGIVGAVAAVIVALGWYGWNVRRRWTVRRLWRRSAADEQALMASAPELLGSWARNLQREANEAGTQDDTGPRADASITDPEPWWVLLEVPRDAPLVDINAAGRKLQALYHPDKNMHLAPMLKLESERIARRINAAIEQAHRERG